MIAEGIRPFWAEIDLDAAAHNVKNIKTRVGPAVEIMCVVKANGYGLDSIELGRVFLENGASRLAVATVDEAILLRKAGIIAPVLVLGTVWPDEAESLPVYDIEAPLGSWETAREFSGIAEKAGRKITVHLKTETGMGRIGVPAENLAAFAEKTAGLAGIEVAGVFTHFSSADEASPDYTRYQLSRFSAALDSLKAVGLLPPLIHCANSASILNYPETYFNCVRPGMMLYGLYPSIYVRRSIPLRAVLELKSRIVSRNIFPPGYSIGYGRTYTTRSRQVIAVLPFGYVDGIHRSLSNKGCVLVRGKKVPFTGNLCMDQSMIDVTSLSEADTGDPVTVIGSQGEERITFEDHAALSGTNIYDIIYRIHPRVPRVFLKNGQPVKIKTLTEEKIL